MSLRNRIGAAAGIAVALTVVSLAFTVYVAVRSELYNQVDRTLNDRARPFATGSGSHADGADPRARGALANGGQAAPSSPSHGGKPAPVPGGDPGGGLGAAAAASRAPLGRPSGHPQVVWATGSATA